MIPASNPAGNNQTNPGMASMGLKPTGSAMAIPGSPAAQSTPNPFMSGVSNTNPAPVAQPSGGAVPGSSASQGFITSGTDHGKNALQDQLIDIYGKGVGASLFELLNSMSGTNSTILQEYIASLQPQMAKAQAGVDAQLGAGGVSANSSVAAIADSSLQAQEFADISAESANLTQSQEQLTAQILTGMQHDAASEVAASGWDVFGHVMSSIGSDVAQGVGAYLGA